MSDLTIITNWHWHELLYGYQLDPKWRKEFDWMEDEHFECEAHFFQYRGWVYTIEEFMRCEPSFPFSQLSACLNKVQWDGYSSDSFFSGILIRYDEDFEQVQVATYIS